MNDEPRYGQTGTNPPGARGTPGTPPRGGRPGQPGKGAHIPSREEVRGAVDAASKEVGRQYEEAKEAVRHKAEETGEQARDYVEQQREGVAHMVGAASRALRTSAGQLDEEQEPTVARYFRWAAEGLEDVADSLHDNDTGDLWSGLNDYARHQPGMAFGGAMAAGFMLSRFLKSHEERGYSAGEPGSYQPSRSTGPSEPASGSYDPTIPGGSNTGGEGLASTSASTPGTGPAGGRPPNVPAEEVRSVTPDPMEPVTLHDESRKEER